MARQDGRFIRLEFDGNFLKGVTSTSIDLAADMIDITNYESDANKEYLSGEKGGTINATFTFDSTVSSANFQDVFTAYDGGTSVPFVYGDVTTSSGVLLSGNVLVSSLNWTGDKNGVSTCDATLTITGAVTLSLS